VKEKTKFSHVDFEFVSRVKFQPATDVSNFTRRPFPNNNNNNNSQNKRWASTFYYKTPIECNKDPQEERVVVLSAAKEKKTEPSFNNQISRSYYVEGKRNAGSSGKQQAA
jgi:hypothetical protein